MDHHHPENWVLFLRQTDESLRLSQMWKDGCSFQSTRWTRRYANRSMVPAGRAGQEICLRMISVRAMEENMEVLGG